MIKKSIFTVLAVGLVAGLLFGRDAFSYIKTASNKVSESVQDSVPTEFQIERARQMVAELSPVIRDSMHKIAKEEVALEQLDKQIAKAESNQQKLEGEIMQLQTDLTSGKSTFRYASRSYSRDQVEGDLNARFTRFKVEDETLASMKEMRNARQANLEAARENFHAMVSEQKNLQTALVNLEAKRELVSVAQASCDINLDDSKLARAKELISDIRASLDVKAKLANADIKDAGEIPLDATENGNVTEQVAAYFGLGEEHSEIASVSFEQQ